MGKKGAARATLDPRLQRIRLLDGCGPALPWEQARYLVAYALARNESDQPPAAAALTRAAEKGIALAEEVPALPRLSQCSHSRFPARRAHVHLQRMARETNFHSLVCFRGCVTRARWQLAS